MSGLYQRMPNPSHTEHTCETVSEELLYGK